MAVDCERQLNLQWKNFHSCFQLSVNSLRDDRCFQDVTLSCSGQLLYAHRLVLAACSTHFRDLFESLPPQQHAVLLLPTVDAEVMRAILDFIYSGEVRVRQSLLGAFLQFADTFCIRGLSGPSGIRGKVGSEPGILRGGAATNRRRSASGDEEVAMKRQCVETEDGVEADEVVGEVAEGAADSVSGDPDSADPTAGDVDCGEEGVESRPLVTARMCAVGDGEAGDGGGGGARRVPPGRRWSSVWEYYTAVDNQLECKLCGKLFRNVEGDPGYSSSNYWKHLRRIHNISSVQM